MATNKTRSTMRHSRPLPRLPADPARVGDYQRSLHSWLEEFWRVYNNYVDAGRLQNDGIYQGVQANFLPDSYWVPFNAFIDRGNQWRKVDFNAASWALKFDQSTDHYEILYSAPLDDPIVWEVFLSFTGVGTPTDGTDIVRLSELNAISDESMARALSVAPDTSALEARVSELENQVRYLLMLVAEKDLEPRLAELEAVAQVSPFGGN